jgi:hypothetical protein
MNALIQVKHATAVFVVALELACFALLPAVQALSPTPDGCYPNFTTAEGCNALNSLTTGAGNTGLGWYSLFSDIDGSFNTGVGVGALIFNNGSSNTAVGAAALLLNTSGSSNTAVGTDALVNNTSGISNTAIGNAALQSNTTINSVSGIYNTATGDHALYNNTNGQYNTANGQSALYNNTTGFFNTANGISALWSNTTGGYNTANGGGALYLNTTGSFNTADGFEALHNNNGDSNTANGYHALYSNVGGGNTAIGSDALLNNTTGGDNIALGNGAGTGVSTATDVIAIGDPGADLSNSCYIGQIFGQPVDPATAVPVFVDTNGKLGTTFSSRRFKHDIKPMDKASEAVLALKPVTFHYKSDTKDTPQFGLIAEDVAAVNPDLVVRNKDGDIYTVRYDQVNAMLLNEFLKEHRKVENLKNDFQAAVAQQQKEIAALTATVKEQAAQIQRVSAQLEASKPAPRVVNNP